MCIHSRCAGDTSKCRAAIAVAIANGSIDAAISATTNVRDGVLGTMAEKIRMTMVSRDTVGPAVMAVVERGKGSTEATAAGTAASNTRPSGANDQGGGNAPRAAKETAKQKNAA